MLSPDARGLVVFVSFTNGFKVDSADGDFSFKIGGRIFVDGGVSTQPRAGIRGQTTS
jgi:hypothetical protein